ncbi:MAG: hypothetical protein CMJ08_05855 [Pelagibacterales bacterium]|nr:hypothetical protein [Pelagibacterales bacterium]
MPKATTAKAKKENIKKELEAFKNKELRKRGVVQPFKIDDMQVDERIKFAIKLLIGEEVDILTTAKTVSNYFREVNKADKKFDRNLIKAKKDYTGKSKEEHNLLRINNFYTKEYKLDLNVCWRDKDSKTSKRMKNSIIKPDMLKNSKILQHKCEHDVIYPQMEKWTRNMAKWYAEAVDA